MTDKGNDKEGLLAELRRRTRTIPPLTDEPEFINSDETLARYLKARDWNIDDADRAIRSTVEYRRSARPLHIDCRWCHERPGFHSMRQVGFDELGRPVMYSCFAQASTHKNKVEDSVVHVTYLTENAKLTMKPGINTWVFIIDCTGMSIPACNPKLGYGVTQIMANHYPERLGMVICINHNPVFQGVWKAIKLFLHPNTVSKMKLIRSKDKILQTFQKIFPEELTKWLLEEINLNKRHPLPDTQRTFWNKPTDAFMHDPRGCPSYVTKQVEKYSFRGANPPPETNAVHKPHPNIIDSLKGKVSDISLPPEELKERERAHALAMVSSASVSIEDSDPEDNGAQTPEIDIDEVFQIPQDAESLHT